MAVVEKIKEKRKPDDFFGYHNRNSIKLWYCRRVSRPLQILSSFKHPSAALPPQRMRGSNPHLVAKGKPQSYSSTTQMSTCSHPYGCVHVDMDSPTGCYEVTFVK